MQELNERKKGKFKISEILIRNNPDIIKKIMGRCIIVKCDYIFLSGTFCYWAYCDDFDEIEPQFGSPEYVWEIDSGLNLSVRKV